MSTLSPERLRLLRHAAILNISRNPFHGHTITQNDNSPSKKSSSELAFMVPLAAIFRSLGSTTLSLFPALSVTLHQRFLEAVFSKCLLWSSAARLHLPLKAPVGFEPVVLGKFKLWEGECCACVWWCVCVMGCVCVCVRVRTHAIKEHV